MPHHDTSRTITDRGAGLTEYAVLLMLVATVCIAVLTVLGLTVNDMLTQARGMF